MHFSSLLCAVALPAVISAFPDTPFVTEGRWVHDSMGENFTYVGVNWPGAGEVMIPEGLQYQSVASIASKIRSLGMNAVRLTFAIEMIDDIEDHSEDVTIQNAFKKALGSANGTTVYEQVIKNNPQFDSSTTRLQVYDNIAAELAKHQIHVHLDNHMSKAEWCCSTTDGNGWFGDTYFNVTKWRRGLEYMASHVNVPSDQSEYEANQGYQSKQWPNMASIGLRNELRQPAVAGTSLPYNWSTWYEQMVAAADVVNAANPDILIFLSGLNFDTTLQPIPWADDLGNGTKFLLTEFKYADKLVLEMHNYQNSATKCSDIESGLWNNGFRAIGDKAVNHMPVLLTEFGYSNANSDYKSVYATCLRKLMPQWKSGWMVWALGGSYYIRSGIQDFDEPWGLLNHNWTAWRNEDAITALEGMVTSTLASVE